MKLLLTAVLSLGALNAAAAQSTIFENQKLTPADGAAGDRFGASVALDGDRAIIGAPATLSPQDDPGAAYVFRRQLDGTWAEAAKLVPSDGDDEDRFGFWVDLDGDYALVSARYDDDGGEDAGAVYVFRRSLAGTWTEEAKLIAGDSVPEQSFGSRCALENGCALIGATHDDENAVDAGAGYVFRRQGDGTWTQEAKLLADDGQVEDWLGEGVALSGDRALLSAAGDDDNGSRAGAAYVFARGAGGAWAQEAKLHASDAAAGDWFGLLPALDGDDALVGAIEPFNDDRPGSVHVFRRGAGGGWTHEQVLTASDGAGTDRFGAAVRLRGDWALVGAATDENGMDSGSAYLFHRDAVGNWTQQAKLVASDSAAEDAFGTVALGGDTAVVGASRDDDNGDDAGAAYLFHLPPACEGDLDGDGDVDQADLGILLGHYGCAW
jgi:hypothetical protein